MHVPLRKESAFGSHSCSKVKPTQRRICLPCADITSQDTLLASPQPSAANWEGMPMNKLCVLLFLMLAVLLAFDHILARLPDVVVGELVTFVVTALVRYLLRH